MTEYTRVQTSAEVWAVIRARLGVEILSTLLLCLCCGILGYLLQPDINDDDMLDWFEARPKIEQHDFLYSRMDTEFARYIAFRYCAVDVDGVCERAKMTNYY